MGRMQDAIKKAADAASAGSESLQPEPPAEFPEEQRDTAGEPAVTETTVAAGEVPLFRAEANEAESAGPPEVDAGDAVMHEPLDLLPEASDGPQPAPGLLQRFQNLRAKVVIDGAMLASSREQYRRLAAALHHAQEASGMKVVMIASAVAGEGKSLTASNLALTFSESYHRSVLLIDGDLRRPSLHRMFKIDAPTGLSDALMTPDDPKLDVFQVSERLTILPAGRPNPDPMAGLTSTRMRRLLEEAREGFEWVFIDTPPVGLLSDANLLSAMVDATVLVIRADRTPYHLVKRAVEALGPDRILGTVLNQATAIIHGYAYDYYRYYQAPRAQSVQGG